MLINFLYVGVKVVMYLIVYDLINNIGRVIKWKVGDMFNIKLG